MTNSLSAQTSQKRLVNSKSSAQKRQSAADISSASRQKPVIKRPASRTCLINFDVSSHVRKAVAPASAKSQDKLKAVTPSSRAKKLQSAERASSSRAFLDKSVLSKSATNMSHKRTRTAAIGFQTAQNTSQNNMYGNNDFETVSGHNVSRMSGRSGYSQSCSGQPSHVNALRRKRAEGCND